MEKRVVLAVVLTIALYVVYFKWFLPSPPPAQQRPVVAQGTAAAPVQGSVAPPPYPQPAPQGAPTTGARRPSEQHPDAPDQKISVRDDRDSSHRVVEFTIETMGGGVKSAAPWACEYHQPDGPPVPGDPGAATACVPGMPRALAVDVLTAARDGPDLTTSNWLLTRVGDAVVAEIDVGGLHVTKTYRPSTDPKRRWHLDCSISVRNVSAKPGVKETLEVFGPVMPKPGAQDAYAAVLVAQAGPDGEVEDLKPLAIQKLLAENPNVERNAATGKWAWIAARADFYLGALVPQGDLPAGTTVGFRTGTRIDVRGPLAATASATFRIPFDVPPTGQEAKYDFVFYAGPNQRALIQVDDAPYVELKGAMAQRSFVGPLVRLMAWVLGLLAGTGMGYGLAVLCLTVLVRLLVFPLSRKSQVAMRVHAQNMARLKPKLDAIKEKYKDAKKQQEATMKVMREEKVPLLPGGCLLPFLQMPIWIALYSVLQTTFEMRHAGFLWIKDLTASDHLVRMPFADGWFVLDGWLNLLPLLMMATWYASAAMQPLPPDPQQAQQAKMMRWMPVVMGVFLYSYPAGLILYMTMSALWSIGESWLIRKLWISKIDLAAKK